MKAYPAMIDITNRADIEQLIDYFYGRVFTDEQLGPIFTENDRVKPETHFPLMADFWETILFARNRYHNNVIQKHVDLHLEHRLEHCHFDRWVGLFCGAVDALFAGPVAETAKIRARTMGMVLQAKINSIPITEP